MHSELRSSPCIQGPLLQLDTLACMGRACPQDAAACRRIHAEELYSTKQTALAAYDSA